MSRARLPPCPADADTHPAADRTSPRDGAQVAEEIGMAVLDLAERARAAGLTKIGYLLESVALEAGTEAAARRWPSEAASR